MTIWRKIKTILIIEAIIIIIIIETPQGLIIINNQATIKRITVNNLLLINKTSNLNNPLHIILQTNKITIKVIPVNQQDKIIKVEVEAKSTKKKKVTKLTFIIYLFI